MAHFYCLIDLESRWCPGKDAGSQSNPTYLPLTFFQSPLTPFPQLKELLDKDFKSIEDFRSKAAQYKPHNTTTGNGTPRSLPRGEAKASRPANGMTRLGSGGQGGISVA